MLANGCVLQGAEAAVFAAGPEYAIAEQRGPSPRDSHRQFGPSHGHHGRGLAPGETEERGIRLPRLGRSGQPRQTRLHVALGDRRDPRRRRHHQRAQGRETRSAGGWNSHFREIAVRGGGIERQVRGRNRHGVFAPAHQARDLVGLRQAVHPAFQAVLVAMLARTKIVAGADPNPAERFAA
jgi:hypothetical protein